MNRKAKKKYKWIEIAILVWTLMGVLAMSVLAAETTGTYSCFQLTASSDGAVDITETSTGWTIKAYGTTGSCNATYTKTVTFTISNTDTTRGVTFNITVSSDDASPSNAPNGSQTLAASGSLSSFTATSGKGSSAYTTINISFSDIEQESLGVSVTTAIKPSTGGTIKVDDTVVTAQTDFTKLDSETYNLTATANSGYTFYGWMSSTDGVLTDDGATSYTYAGKKAATLWPLFLKSGSAMYYILGASPMLHYGYLDEAIAAAGSSGTVVVYRSGTVYHSNGTTDTFTIPSGVTLLLPYSADDTSIKSGTGSTNDFKHANVQFPENEDKSIVVKKETDMDPELDVLYTLTIPNGTTVTVNGESSNPGRIVIGGTIVGSQGTNSAVAEGLCYGAHSNLVVDGNLNLGSYSVLSAVGYVLGGGEIKTINADGTNSTGAEIYQPFVIHDWRGGRAAQFGVTTTLSSALATQSGESQVIPFFQWTTMNIHPKLTMTYGNQMIMYASLYDGDAYTSHATLVGPSGLVQLSEGASLTSYYEDIDWGSYGYGFPGRNNVTISGGASLGSFTMTGKLAVGSIAINTANFTLPICYGYSITLVNGTFNLNNPMALLPGSKIEVTDTATLNVSANRFMVFDGLNQGLYHNVSSTGINSPYAENTRSGSQKVKLYPTTGELQGATVNGSAMSADAEFIVDGTLVIGANANFGGVIQTSGTGTIDARAGTADTTTGAKVQIGVVGNKAIMSLSENSSIAGMSLHEMNAQVVSAATGERMDVIRGNIYKGSERETTQEGYSFKYYADAASVTSVILIGDAVAGDGETATTTHDAHPLNETIRGAWCAHSWQTATCTEPKTCSICGATEGKPLGHAKEAHAAKAPTYNEEGNSAYWSCEVCGNYYADEGCTNLIEADSWILTVATVGNNSFTVLSAAVNDASTSGETVTLQTSFLEDITISQHVTINKGDYTANITAGEDYYSKTNENVITIRHKLNIAATNIAVNDGLDLYFYVNAEYVDENTTYTAVITKYFADGRETSVKRISSKVWISATSNGKSYLGFSFADISAKEMTDNVTVIIYEGDLQVSDPFTETVQSYAIRTLEQTSTSDLLKTALMDMLNYGTAAQQFFDYNKDVLANVDPPGKTAIEDNSEHATEDVKELENSLNGVSDNFAGTTVSATNTLMFTFYFNITDPTDMTATITYKDHNGADRTETVAGAAFYKRSEGLYGVDVLDLSIVDGRCMITCTITDSNGAVVAKATDSIEGYAARKSDGNDDIFEQMMKFVDSASAYFDSQKSS